jgi:hypothetical protein
MGARNRASRNSVVVPARQATQAGGIDSLESILGLLKSLKIRAQDKLIKNLRLERNSKVK